MKWKLAYQNILDAVDSGQKKFTSITEPTYLITEELAVDDPCFGKM